ncbi:MAG: hypothetical protein OEY56_02720 [Cyclobacteriaceae bacterium]|nr:hypothetical protein [Cyclobacteriaceae bacterium]
MKVKATQLKEWSNATFSPLAWQRIALRSLPVLIENGIELDDIENPQDGMILEGDVLTSLIESVENIYKTEVPATLINA